MATSQDKVYFGSIHSEQVEAVTHGIPTQDANHRLSRLAMGILTTLPSQLQEVVLPGPIHRKKDADRCWVRDPGLTLLAALKLVKAETLYAGKYGCRDTRKTCEGKEAALWWQMKDLCQIGNQSQGLFDVNYSGPRGKGTEFSIVRTPKGDYALDYHETKPWLDAYEWKSLDKTVLQGIETVLKQHHSESERQNRQLIGILKHAFISENPKHPTYKLAHDVRHLVDQGYSDPLDEAVRLLIREAIYNPVVLTVDTVKNYNADLLRRGCLDERVTLLNKVYQKLWASKENAQSREDQLALFKNRLNTTSYKELLNDDHYQDYVASTFPLLGFTEIKPVGSKQD